MSGLAQRTRNLGPEVPCPTLTRLKKSAAKIVPETPEGAKEGASSSSQEPLLKKAAFLDVNFPSTLESGSSYANSYPSSSRSSSNSIDFRFINHLVGPGTTSSRQRTASWMIVEGLDVSQALMNARREVVAHPYITLILGRSLNFIFDAAFMKKCLTPEVCSKLPRVEIPDTTSEKIQSLSKRLWQNASRHSLENEDTYTEMVVKSIVFGVLGDLDSADHWSRDPLQTPRGFEEKYLPDYFSEKDGLPFLIAEVKKPPSQDGRAQGQEGLHRPRRADPRCSLGQTGWLSSQQWNMLAKHQQHARSPSAP
ncbi:hypothetical protein EDD21DRAFT_445262 [Dissophora ornata]|nr:hypothetical protein EDD21DRAFT_445262 [Dissophora ornata]